MLDWISVKWPSLVGYPIVPLLLVAGLGIVLHVKRLEVQLIYRYHFQRGKRDGGQNANTHMATKTHSTDTQRQS